MPRRIDPARDAEIVRRYLAGDGVKTLPPHYRNVLRRNGVAPRGKGPLKGAPRRPYDPARLDAMLAMRKQHKTLAEIGAAFGLSKWTVGDYLAYHGHPPAQSRRPAKCRRRAAAPSTAMQTWPYSALALQDPTIAAIHAAVPRWWPEAQRAEVCQAAFMDALLGTPIDTATRNARCAYRRNYESNNFSSLDAFVGAGGLRLHETLGEDRALWR